MRILALSSSLVVFSQALLVAQQTSQLPATKPAKAGNLEVTAAIVLPDLTVRPVPLLRMGLLAADDTLMRYELRTGLDGKTSQSVGIGTYRLKSLAPVQVGDSAFTWDVPVTVTDRGGKVELTNANAAVTFVPSVTSGHQVPASPRSVYAKAQAGVFRVEAELGTGSGFLIDEVGGVVVTNDHVIGTGTNVSVYVDSVTRLPAVVLARDRDADLAVLVIPLALCPGCVRLPLATIPATGELIQAGEPVLAIGFPLDQEKTLTSGVASSVRKGAIISDVNINHGNSGGPMLNMAGEVIGINTFIDPSSVSGPGIYGAIAVTQLLPLLATAQALPRPAVEERRLPVMPLTAVPVSLIKAIADTANPKPYGEMSTMGAGKFVIGFATPVSQQVARGLQGQAVSKDRKKREAKAGLSSDESYSTMKDMYDWGRFVGGDATPVVAIQVTPKQGETFWSAMGRGLEAYSYGASVSPAKMKFLGDVRGARFYRDGVEVTPLRGGHGPQAFYVDNAWVEFKDVADWGYYVLAPETFAPDSAGTPPQIVIVVQDLKNPTNLSSLTVAPAIAARVWNEFVPFMRAEAPERTFIWADPQLKSHHPKLRCDPESGECVAPE